MKRIQQIRAKTDSKCCFPYFLTSGFLLLYPGIMKMRIPHYLYLRFLNGRNSVTDNLKKEDAHAVESVSTEVWPSPQTSAVRASTVELWGAMAGVKNQEQMEKQASEEGTG